MASLSDGKEHSETFDRGCCLHLYDGHTFAGKLRGSVVNELDKLGVAPCLASFVTGDAIAAGG